MENNGNKLTIQDLKELASEIFNDFKEEKRTKSRLQSAYKSFKNKIIPDINLEDKYENAESKSMENIFEVEFAVISKSDIGGPAMQKFISKVNGERIDLEKENRIFQEHITNFNKTNLYKKGVMISVDFKEDTCLVVKADIDSDEEDDSFLFKLDKELLITKRAMTRLSLWRELKRVEREQEEA